MSPKEFRAHLIMKLKRETLKISLLLMFWNTYLYRHVCALTPARIRKTQIQNVDKMPVMRKKWLFEGTGGGKLFSETSWPTDWNAECNAQARTLHWALQKLLWAHGFFWLGLFLWKESELHFFKLSWYDEVIFGIDIPDEKLSYWERLVNSAIE